MHQKIDTAIILAGGDKKLSNPTCLKTVNGVNILDSIIKSLISANITNIIISTHYHFDLIDEFIANYSGSSDLNIYTIREQQLLGSGGAIKNIFLSTNLTSALIIESHLYDEFDYQKILYDFQNQICENVIIQSLSTPDLFSGRYILNSEIFNYTHLTKFSFEKELLPIVRADDIETISTRGFLKKV